MDNMHWMKLCTATGKKERETLETMKVPSAGIQCKATDGGHPQVACTHASRNLIAPARLPALHGQQYHNEPFSCQPNSCDGSLNDMLLPYQYDKLLDDLLSEQGESLVEPREPISQLYHTNPLPGIAHSINGDGIILNDDGVSVKLASDITNSHQNFMVISPRRAPIAPSTPARTRRPPMRKGTPSYRENHIHTERQRRQDMTSLFIRLKSVLPNMQHEDLKGDRCTILDHVIDYVQELDKKVQALGKVKAELLQGEEAALIHHHRPAHQTAFASADSVSVRPWGHVDIFITLNCPKQRGLWPHLLALLQDTLQLDVQNVALSSTPLFCVHSIYAKVMGNDSEEVCCKVKKTLREFVTDHAYSNHFMR